MKIPCKDFDLWLYNVHCFKHVTYWTCTETNMTLKSNKIQKQNSTRSIQLAYYKYHTYINFNAFDTYVICYVLYHLKYHVYVYVIALCDNNEYIHIVSIQ